MADILVMKTKGKHAPETEKGKPEAPADPPAN